MLALIECRAGSSADGPIRDEPRPDPDTAPGEPPSPPPDDDRPLSFWDALRRMLASVHS